MDDIWIICRIKLKWLVAAVFATKEQSIRDHDQARKDPERAKELRGRADSQDAASEGLKQIHKGFEDDV